MKKPRVPSGFAAGVSALVAFTCVASVAHAHYRRMPAVACRNAGGNSVVLNANAAGSLYDDEDGNYGANQHSAVCPIVNDDALDDSQATHVYVDFSDQSGYDAVRAQVCINSADTNYTQSCGTVQYSSNLTGGSTTLTASTTGNGWLVVPLGSPSTWSYEGYATVYVTIPGWDDVNGTYSYVNGYDYDSN